MIAFSYQAAAPRTGGWSPRSRDARRGSAAPSPAAAARRWSSKRTSGWRASTARTRASCCIAARPGGRRSGSCRSGARRSSVTTRGAGGREQRRQQQPRSARSGRDGWSRTGSRSRPSVCRRGGAITPALLISRSSARDGGEALSERARPTQVGEVELHGPPRSPRIAGRHLARPWRRPGTAITTDAPARASSRAVAEPETAVRAGHDDHAAALIRDVGRRPLRRHQPLVRSCHRPRVRRRDGTAAPGRPTARSRRRRASGRTRARRRRSRARSRGR